MASRRWPPSWTASVSTKRPVAVVDQDRSALSRQITRYAWAHPSINVIAVTPDLRDAQDLIWRNKAAVAAYAIMVGNLFRSRERSAQLLLCTAMPVMFLSGVTWPVEALPGPLQALRWLIPSTPGIQGFVALNQLGADLGEVATEAAALAGLLAGSVVLGFWRWRRTEKAQRQRRAANPPSASPAANKV